MAGINRPNTPPKKPTVQAPQTQQRKKGLPLKPVKESVDPSGRKGRNK
ncbi:hypothetical protein [Clostridium vincentii]|uniref:Uncharacterized protein n=1 Tax=Clostridium vincentii TaxID=52704 RepID=A0A2T0BBZ3_9CLOT|nr:hypothetical protein [Clostridium vincentii]PRR81362.1 hypothetical protein CLVI_25950 [Clostridium vincentii]